MKKIIYPLLILLSISVSMAQPKKGQIPSNVNRYINLHYPDAKKVHWMVHEGYYIVSLWSSDMHVEVCLNEKGEYQNSLKEILYYDELPAKVKSTVDIRHLSYAEKLESRNGDLFYILEVHLPKGKIEELIFDKKGKEVKDYIVDEQPANNEEDVLKF